jgi:hypothetical protein
VIGSARADLQGAALPRGRLANPVTDQPDEQDFLRRYLEPADRLNEVLFGLIMVLTFTLTAGFTLGTGPDAAHELLLATLGCNVAWGIIDGAMYLMGQMLERSRRARTIARVRSAPDEATALAEIHRYLDGTLVSLASEAERERVFRVVYDVARRAPPEHTRVYKEDVYGGLLGGLLVIVSTVPAAIPFLFIQNAWLALRVSNALLVGLLFVAGYRWGVHAHASPWLAGFAFLLGGLALVALCVALGG